MSNPQTYRPEGNPRTPMIIALWILVALSFFQNFQLIQLSADVRQLQALNHETGLTPSGPLPNDSGNGEYANQLTNIDAKLEKLNGLVENIGNNVSGIKSDTGSHGGAASGGGAPIPNQ